MKSANWISATGRMPFSAAPIATPTIPSSASGVSITRPSPNRSRSPSVALKTPPFTPTSSPITSTRSSRPISAASVSRTVSTIVFNATVLPLGLLSIHVSAQGLRRRLRTRLGEGNGVVDRGDRALAKVVVELTIQDPPLLKEPTEEVERIATARQLQILGWPIAAVVVVARMRRQAVDPRVDQRRTAAGAGALQGLDRRVVDGERIGAVDGDARHPIRGGTLGDGGHAHLLLAGHRDRPAVVLADEDDRQAVNAGEVESL